MMESTETLAHYVKRVPYIRVDAAADIAPEGEWSPWLHVGTLPAREAEGPLAATDPCQIEYGYTGEEQLTLPAGELDVLVRLVTIPFWGRRVAEIRIGIPDGLAEAQVARGGFVVDINTGTLAFVDLRDPRAAQAATEVAWEFGEDVSEAALQLRQLAAVVNVEGVAVVITSSGFGDGGYGVEPLSAAGRTIGLAVTFITEDDLKPTGDEA